MTLQPSVQRSLHRKFATCISFILLSSLTSINVADTVKNQTTKNQFVGTWELLSVERKDAQGIWSPSVGQLTNSVGVLMYDEFGRMSVHIMNLDRNVSANRALQLTEDELRELLRGYVAYFGDYEINASEGYVIHRRRGHLYPSQVGVDAKRFFEFSDGLLTLTVAPSRNFRLTWQRVSR